MYWQNVIFMFSKCSWFCAWWEIVNNKMSDCRSLQIWRDSYNQQRYILLIASSREYRCIYSLKYQEIDAFNKLWSITYICVNELCCSTSGFFAYSVASHYLLTNADLLSIRTSGTSYQSGSNQQTKFSIHEKAYKQSTNCRPIWSGYDASRVPKQATSNNIASQFPWDDVWAFQCNEKSYRYQLKPGFIPRHHANLSIIKVFSESMLMWPVHCFDDTYRFTLSDFFYDACLY